MAIIGTTGCGHVKVRGVVLDSDNNPVEGATVRIYKAGGELALLKEDTTWNTGWAEGFYEFNFYGREFEDGEYTVKAEGMGYESRTDSSTKNVSISVGAGFIIDKTIEVDDLIITPILCSIQGQVTNAGNGQPISGVSVSLEYEYKHLPYVMCSTTTDSSGNYSLPKVFIEEEYLYFLRASKNGYTESSTEPTLERDKTIVVNFQLEPQ